jgi:MYXO-CTERM domain-containing protein
MRWCGFLLCLALSGTVSAAIIQADFQEVLDLPYYSGSGPRVVERANVTLPLTGTILDATYQVSNPSYWNNMLNVSFDSATNVLSLTGDGFNSYQIITITLSNLAFDASEVIIGLTPIATNLAAYDEGWGFLINTSFTGNSATITYRVPDLDAYEYFLITGAGTDQFQLTLGSAGVPEPGTLGVAAFGLAALLTAILRRRRN